MADENEIVEPEDESIISDIDDPDYVPVDDDDKPSDDDDKPEEDDKPDKELDRKEEKDDPLEALRKELTEDFTKKIADKDKEINRLGYALRTGKKDDKGEGKDEPKFTDAQLLAIMQEHKDDPTVMLQVFKEIADTKGKQIEKSAEKAADIKTKKNEMTAFVSKAYPATMEEGSEAYDAISKAVEWFHLDGHPFARELAIAGVQLRQLPEMLKKIKDDAKSEVLKEAAETARKKGIKEDKPDGKGDKPDESKQRSGLTPAQMETAKKLGFAGDKRALAKYAKMIGAKGNTFSAST